jgi:hypothetical protein
MLCDSNSGVSQNHALDAERIVFLLVFVGTGPNLGIRAAVLIKGYMNSLKGMPEMYSYIVKQKLEGLDSS